jgi:TDG/mug DNA glycosylase family protein
MPVLPDVLRPGLAVVFCGTGAGRKSAELRAYYAKPGNKFWRTLYEVGLTPQRVAPHAYRDVPALGLGLTDIAKEHIGQDHEIDPAHVDAAGLRRRIARAAPAILAFTSKKAASLFLDRPTGTIAYGFQPETIGPTRIFVLTSPSGQAGSYWDIAPWRELARAAKAARRG